MTDEKSQVAVKLTAEDIEKYFSNNDDNYNPLVDFLFNFRSRGLSLNDIKIRILSKKDREYTVMIMDNSGKEHECVLIDTFIDNMQDILSDLFPESIFGDLVDKETESEITFYKTCTLPELEEYLKYQHISDFRRVFLPSYGEYYPILHLLENTNKDVIKWVIQENPPFGIVSFVVGDNETEDLTVCDFIQKYQKNPELREMLLDHYKGQ